MAGPGDISIGLDVGSTTVKAVMRDAQDGSVLWKDYRRHEGRQVEHARAMLGAIESSLGDSLSNSRRVVFTGSGAASLTDLIGGGFLQEVNALTFALEYLHPDAGSAIELGGQDAKIIVVKRDARTGERQSLVSMNTKCAAGTGATLDKCFAKLGLTGSLASLAFEPHMIHRVASRCGVFAETDVINLLKGGASPGEAVNSLVDAVVRQNLTALGRGETLRPRVLLLGGPNAFLTMLPACWRYRIRESWDAAGYEYPRHEPIEHLILVPENAEYYAAYGAALYGAREAADVPAYRGLDALERALGNARVRVAVRQRTGPPLVRDAQELNTFKARYALPEFTPLRVRHGETVRAALGVDGGSTSSKCVLVDDGGRLLNKAYQLSNGNPIADVQAMLARLQAFYTDRGATLQVTALGVTGYGGELLDKALGADARLVETVAHLESAVRTFGDVDVICDIGGQDMKVLFVRQGCIQSFRLSSQCSAGNGVLLHAMAKQLGIELSSYADVAFTASASASFQPGCAVFLDSDRITFQRDGWEPPELLSGLALVLPKNIWQHVVQVPRLAALGRRFVLQGGTQRNLAAVKAQVDYILERVPGAEVQVHPHPGEAGAIGAALTAAEAVGGDAHSRFIGIDAALGLCQTSRSDPTTRCGFCPNHCTRTFVHIDRTQGPSVRHISGHGCERGSAADTADLKSLNRAHRERNRHFPNLVAEEARLSFRRVYTPLPLPAAGTAIDAVEVRRRPLAGVARRAVRRGFERSPASAARARRAVRIGIPRVLNLWCTAPFWRAYFEALGIGAGNIVFSQETSETLWEEGNRYGSTDPCFPAKVSRAHVHNLLFEIHPKRSLDYIFFPGLTHLPTFLGDVTETACCPVVAGTPVVIRAEFTRERDLFAESKVVYVSPVLGMSERTRLKHQLFLTWGDRLAITEDESDFAVDQGWAALGMVEAKLQQRAREVLEAVAARNGLAILVLGRPYHADPGVHHGIVEAIQRLGYPVLSLRALPTDPAWLAPLFADGSGSPLDIRAVLPESYSVNSAQKVWAAGIAARHPNLAVVDLSSFKCGQDAPTYGTVDTILATAACPHLTLHDLDANNPTGSLSLRIQTFAHSLQRYEARLKTRAEEAAAGSGCGSILDGELNAPAAVKHWREPAARPFTVAQRARTTILHGGLTATHDALIAASLRGLGYRAQALPPPDDEALRVGREYCNRAQCNPAYFTVGNLIRYLEGLRRTGMSTRRIIDTHVFTTAGACGPCRFGTYLGEYRRALREAGFDGFRIIAFQQSTGAGQVAHDESGLRFDRSFYAAILKATMVGDVLNLLGYRIRPYELEPGVTDAALGRAREAVAAAFARRDPLWPVLWRCRRELASIGVDRTRVKPRVGLTGEFWAMTTEGDGSYRLQRFLEREGAEVEVEPVTSWVLYLIWQGRHDARARLPLRGTDGGRFGLAGVSVRRRLLLLGLAETALRAYFRVVATALGLSRHGLADMEAMARVAHPYYDTDLRGGEGHMEVGKLIHNAVQRRTHLTLSIKPFGCLPSSALSDGIQPLVNAHHPESLFLPVETSGDAAANVHSRVQMQLYRAREVAARELDAALDAAGSSMAELRTYLGRHRGLAGALHASPHRVAGTTANLVYEVAQRLRTRTRSGTLRPR